MKIVMLEGSPNKQGSSNMLAEEFARGAKETGHEIVTISAAHSRINPCTGCVSCGYDGPCVQKDDMGQIRQEILGADMLVFVTPLYYYGMSAQLKILVDRFCALNGSIQRKRMKSVLISAAWNNDDWTFDALEAHYHTLVKYLNFKDEGMILGKGCGTPSMTKNSSYPQLAYKLGKTLISK
ncbi:MAG: flavodoxin family protein [Lachnospiraceae bacterium]|nr:flavodoxin family protein [Lachnospiraceae bacterium]